MAFTGDSNESFGAPDNVIVIDGTEVR